MTKTFHIPCRYTGIMAPRQGLLILVACLVLCSCRAPHADWQATRTGSVTPFAASHQRPPAAVAGPQQHRVLHDASNSSGNVIRMVSHESVAHEMAAGPGGRSGFVQAAPEFVSYCPYPPLVAPMLPAMQGAAGWHAPPQDEMIRDGGDREGQIRVGRDFTVYGIDAEDTVAHFDTLDGKTRVEPSNRVEIYAPRFAAVRQVSVAAVDRQQQLLGNVYNPQLIVSQERRVGGTSVAQPVQVEGNSGAAAPYAFRDHNRAAPLSNARFLQAIAYQELPYEEAALVAGGLLENSDKPRLAEAITAAKTWSADQGPQVVVDGVLAVEDAGSVGGQETMRYDMPEGKPRLRIVKLASKQNALPGETVDFTIRFDNIGDQPIGNVTILDNLTARLEYVADSAQSTLDADFFAVDQSDNSLILRWEIKNPLDVGEGGVIQFRCQVR